MDRQAIDPEIIRLEKLINKLENAVRSQGATITGLMNHIKVIENKLISVERKLKTDINNVRTNKHQ